MKIKASIVACGIMLACSHYALAAGSISGQLDVRLTIGEGCSISNGGASGSFNQFGTLDFGVNADLSAAIDAESSSSAGANAIQIICSPTLAYNVTVDGGQNSQGVQRRMQNQTNGLTNNYVSYDLYQDASRTTAWVAGTPFANTGTGDPISLVFYGRVPQVASPAPAAGTYTDSVLVSIDW